MGQMMAFWSGQRTGRARSGLWPRTECEKDGKPNTAGCILSWLEKQIGNPKLGRCGPNFCAPSLFAFPCVQFKSHFRVSSVTTSLFDLYKIGVGPSSSH